MIRKVLVPVPVIYDYGAAINPHAIWAIFRIDARSSVTIGILGLVERWHQALYHCA